ncbi:MAG: hypothetical protein ABI644_11815 [Arenimonas sp.]
MFRKISLIVLLTILLSSFAAFAGQAYVNVEQRLSTEQLHETGLDTLSPAQIERLNQLLRDDSIKTAAAEKAEHKDDAVRTSYIGLEDKPIKSRLTGTINGWDVDTVFELENGQKWKVLKGSMKLRKPMQSPEIIVVPGFAGRWFLQVDEDLPKARVYRID